MHPYLLELRLGPWATLRLPSYGAMIAIGFLLCLYLLQRRGRRMGLDHVALFDMATLALFGGLVGSRALYVAQNWAAFRERPWTFFAVWQGGLSFFGGLIGGAACALYIIHRRRLPVRPTLDLAASLVPLGHAFGRVGCFLKGCCYGRVTDWCTGVRFPRLVEPGGLVVGSPSFVHHLGNGLISPAAEYSLPVHPTQLYEAGYNLAIFALLTYLLPRRRRSGDVAALYLVLYGSARFVNEFFRADNVRFRALGGLTAFQLISATFVLTGAALLAVSLSKPREERGAAEGGQAERAQC